jgi:hypothetical protein
MLSIFPALLAALVALPAAAETPMTGAEFETYVTGNTMTYGREDDVHGTMDYLPGRRYRWAFGDDPCVDGYWYEKGNQICSVDETDMYSTDGSPECFLFFEDPDGLHARFMGEGGSDNDMIHVRKIDGPLWCPDAGA